jgi:hypothetical protein
MTKRIGTNLWGRRKERGKEKGDDFFHDHAYTYDFFHDHARACCHICAYYDYSDLSHHLRR